MPFSQKTALVTGTSKGGIGDYLVRELHRRGIRVFATARDVSKVEHLQDMGIEIIVMDVLDAESIKTAASEVKTLTGGSLDILINNSGVGYNAFLLDADMADAKQIFDVNVFGLLAVTQAFAPLLTVSKGTIVNIGSIVSRIPLPYQGIYNASKAAVEQFSKQMRVELGPFGIKVVHVTTGGIKTDFFAHAEHQEVPNTSLYYPGRNALKSWLNGELQMEQQITPPEEYARSVVNNILSRKPVSCQWLGRGSWYTWLFSNYLWGSSTDFLIQQMGWPSAKSIMKEGAKSG